MASIVWPMGSEFFWTKSISSLYLEGGFRNNLFSAVPPLKTNASLTCGSLYKFVNALLMIKSCST